MIELVLTGIQRPNRYTYRKILIFEGGRYHGHLPIKDDVIQIPSEKVQEYLKKIGPKSVKGFLTLFSNIKLEKYIIKNQSTLFTKFNNLK